MKYVGYHAYIYGLYIDSTNWLRLDINCNANTWAVVKNINGSTTTLDSGGLPYSTTGGNYYGFFVRRYDYFKFNFYDEFRRGR